MKQDFFFKNQICKQRLIMFLCRYLIVNQLRNKFSCVQSFVPSVRTYCQESHKQEDEKTGQKDSSSKQALIVRNFENASNKDKSTYIEMIKIFEEKNVHRRNHVEFIYAALKNMEAFGVHKDLETYKALINVMPKGKFIPQNMFQAEFMHYPKQQQCIIDLLEQMEDQGEFQISIWLLPEISTFNISGVIPDYEMEDMLVNVFGRKGHPVRKFWRMMYWMPKFKNLSPWLLPNPVPDEILELAKLAVERMCSVDIQSTVSIYQTKDVESSIDDTWIVSGQSVEQKELLTKHEKSSALHIEGPFLIWLRNKSINYFVLRGDPKPDAEEEDEDVDGEI